METHSSSQLQFRGVLVQTLQPAALRGLCWEEQESKPFDCSSHTQGSGMVPAGEALERQQNPRTSMLPDPVTPHRQQRHRDTRGAVDTIV